MRIDYAAHYNTLRDALADRDTPKELTYVITIPGGRAWALKAEQTQEAKDLALLLLRHPKIDRGVTPMDFMGGVGNEDFPYFSQTHEPLIAIAIALKEGYIKFHPLIGKYLANTENTFVVEYIQDLQNRYVNLDNVGGLH